MSISSINNPTTFTQTNSGQASVGASDVANTTHTVGTAVKSGTAAIALPVPSTTVTLSTQALSFASLNAAGVTTIQLSAEDLAGMPKSFATEADLEQAVQVVRNAAIAASPPKDGAVTKADFDTLASQFGTTKAQADQVFDELDSDNNGSVSNDELLSGLGKTGSASGSASSQALMKMVDKNSDGTVDESEFVNFEGAVISAEKSVS